MAKRIDIRDYVDITIKVQSPPPTTDFVPTPLWFIKTPLIGRGQYIFIDSPSDAEDYPFDLTVTDFINKFFTFKDKDGLAPQGLYLANSSLEAVDAALITQELSKVPGKHNGTLYLTIDNNNYELNLTTSESSTWTSIAQELQKVLRDTVKTTALKVIAVSYNSQLRRMMITTPKLGQHSIIVTPGKENEAMNVALGFSSKAHVVLGGDATTFDKNVKDLMDKLRNKVAIAAWDNKFDDLTTLVPVVSYNEDLKLGWILCYSSPNKVLAATDINSLPSVAFCYEQSVIDENYFDSMTTAFLLTQLVSSVRFQPGGILPDFTRVPTDYKSNIIDKKERRDLLDLRANFIVRTDFSEYNTNLFEGGYVLGDRTKGLVFIRSIIGERWIQHNIEQRAYYLMTHTAALTTSSSDLSKVESIVTNVAEMGISNGIIASASGMSEATAKLLAPEVESALKRQNYYVRVYRDDIKEGVRNEAVIKYELHYFTGNIVYKIIGTHSIYT